MSVIVYQCPNCGAGLKFNSESQRWDCEFCQTSHSLEELQAEERKEEQDTQKDIPDHQPGDKSQEDGQMNVFVCPQCAGEIVTDQTTAATSCVYCGNPTILPERLSGEFRPDFILPFSKSKEDAMASYREFIKKKPLLPGLYKKENEIDKITGIYVPFWIYDFKAQADLSTTARNVSKWTSGDYRYTKTDHYQIEREAYMRFTQVPADGSSKMEDEFMESIEPFHLDQNQIQKFSFAYLSGFLAEKYDVDSETVLPRMRERIKVSATDVVKDSVSGYTSVDSPTVGFSLQKERVNQILLPVWIMTSRYRGRVYRFAMNGQTGKIVGILPISIKRCIACFSGSFFLLCLLWLLIWMAG